jgi:hypothetical protein
MKSRKIKTELFKFTCLSVIMLLLCQSGFSQQQKKWIELFHPLSNRMIFKGDKVILYEHKHYFANNTGGSIEGIDVTALFNGDDDEIYIPVIPLEDIASGIFVPRGVVVTAYEHRGKKGAKWTFAEGYHPDLWKSNDVISSMTITLNENSPRTNDALAENAAILFESSDPANATSWNRSHSLAAGVYSSDWNSKNSIDAEDAFKYLYVKGAYTVVLYENKDFGGASHEFKDEYRGVGTWYDLSRFDLRDKVSSVKVEGGKYECYDLVLGTPTDVPLVGEARNEIRTVSVSAVNNTQDIAPFPAEVSKTIESSLEISRENTTEMSTSATITIGTPEAAPTKFELAITAGVSHAISNGESRGTATQDALGAGFEPSVRSGCRGATVLVSRPIKQVYKDAKLLFREIDAKGKPVANGHEFSEPIEINVDGSTKVEFDAVTFCESDIREAMLQNNWSPDNGHTDKNSIGKFVEDGKENLIWENALGEKIKLEPEHRQMSYKSTSGDKKFRFGIKAGVLDHLIFGDKKLYPSNDPTLFVNNSNSAGSYTGGGDTTAKGGSSLESDLLSKTFKLQNATNGYHEGTFTKLANGNLEWKNKAGVKWALKPMYASNFLDTTVGDCYYKTQNGGDKFILLMENGGLKGFKFMGEEYLVVN